MSKDEQRFHFKLEPQPSQEPADPERLAGMSPEDAVRAMFAEPMGPWITVFGGGLPCPVRLRLGRDRYGQLAVTGLELDGTRSGEPFNITSTLLREVGAAISDLLRRIAEHRMSGNEA